MRERSGQPLSGESPRDDATAAFSSPNIHRLTRSPQRPDPEIGFAFTFDCKANSRRRSGQASLEFALLYAGVMLPLTFMLVFVAEMLWVWHSVVDFTRDGARYAATHCWESDNSNVLGYMTSHVPRMIDMDQFQNGAAGITVTYYQLGSDGTLTEFTGCTGDCSTTCIPDTVTVSVTGYQFNRLTGLFRFPAVPLPDFHASVPMAGAGCDETGTCNP